jgi:hypothetical protein
MIMHQKQFKYMPKSLGSSGVRMVNGLGLIIILLLLANPNSLSSEQDGDDEENCNCPEWCFAHEALGSVEVAWLTPVHAADPSCSCAGVLCGVEQDPEQDECSQENVNFQIVVQLVLDFDGVVQVEADYFDPFIIANLSSPLMAKFGCGMMMINSMSKEYSRPLDTISSL